MLRVRLPVLEDVPALARIDVEAWRATYPGILPDKVLLTLSPARLARQWEYRLRHRSADLRVAEWSGSGAVGFGECGAAREAIEGFAGEVFTLYVDPDFQGRGAGRALLLALFRRLVASGMLAAAIWVLRDNPARFFYERLGGRQVAQRKISIGGAMVPALGYGWADLPATLQQGGRALRRLADDGAAPL